jgi:hypothetical protein
VQPQQTNEYSEIERQAEETQEALRRSIERSRELTREAEQLLERNRREPGGGSGPDRL